MDKMKIFITWSGPQSRAVAEALKEYLPVIVNDFAPWLSTANIDKGANWGTELTAALATARAGIICLTPTNLEEPWILFEAGAIAKAVTEKPLACTLLIGLKSSEVSGPLALFQDTKPTHDDLLQLVKTLNSALGEDAVKEKQLERAFDLVWPELERKLDNLPADASTKRPQRSDRELLEEIVDTVRSTSHDDSVLLKFAAERIAEISARLATLEDARFHQPEPLRGLRSYWDMLYETPIAQTPEETKTLGRRTSVQEGPTLSRMAAAMRKEAKEAAEKASKTDPKKAK
jgi:TIR domain-containing protein